MKIKNIILLLFVIFALNSYYQPVQTGNTKYRHTIVRQINFEEDKLTIEIKKKNDTYILREFISIKMQLMIAERFYEAFNTS